MTSSQLRFALALIIAGLAVCTCFPSEEKDLLASEWEAYKLAHGKNYESPEEEEMRLNIFKGNRQMVLDHNERFQRGEESYNIGLNHFSDQTEEELVSYTTGFNGEEALNSLDNVPAYIPSNVAVPNEMDWRQKGAVTQVKDQKNCGGCYAFSSTGAIEGMHFIKTGKLVSLSEQQIIACSAAYGNNRCRGGLMDNSFNYIKAVGGIASESAYPYENQNGTCKFQKSTVAATITGYKHVGSSDENALKEVVGSIGPVSVGINGGLATFQHYNGQGVFSDSSCPRNSNNHAVLAVGYGTENGKDYWLIKNSWGAQWGAQGYIKLARNSNNMCGIGTYAVYPTV